eukprot:38250_1
MSEDYLAPKKKPPPMHEQWEIRNIVDFGGSYKGVTENKDVDNVKMGEIQVEESVMFNVFKYYNDIYCILQDNKIMKYYRNRNDYYLSQRNKNRMVGIKGCINLSKSFKIKKIENSIFEIGVNVDAKTKIWKFKCKNENERNEWYDIINKMKQ